VRTLELRAPSVHTLYAFGIPSAGERRGSAEKASHTSSHQDRVCFPPSASGSNSGNKLQSNSQTRDDESTKE
jgi:hypothetical protein